MAKQAARERFSVPIGENRLAYFGRWPHADGKYRNFAIMHTEARERLVQFVADRERILSDERLAPTGKREEIAKAVSAFHKVAANWQGNAVKDRKPQILEEITAMRGVSSRKEGDLVGQMADWEMRTWYKGLKGDELSQFNGGLARGEHAGKATQLPDRTPGDTDRLDRSDDVFGRFRRLGTARENHRNQEKGKKDEREEAESWRPELNHRSVSTTCCNDPKAASKA